MGIAIFLLVKDPFHSVPIFLAMLVLSMLSTYVMLIANLFLWVGSGYFLYHHGHDLSNGRWVLVLFALFVFIQLSKAIFSALKRSI